MSRVEPVQDPRIAKKEMIITRFKSAQQRKQMGEKEGNKQPDPVTKEPAVTKVLQTTSKLQVKVAKLPQKTNKLQETVAKLQQAAKQPQISKSPRKNRPVKQGKPQKCSNKKEKVDKDPILEDDNREFYPEKTKRAPGSKKMFLKPKQKSTMIARTNKRKFNTPKRGIESPSPNQSTFQPDPEPVQCQSPEYSDLSMAEVIRIVEENDSLDDEDLMEILTCPSPVWWEEPPDEMYIEEAICSRKPEENATGKIKSPIRERCFNTLKNTAKLANKMKTQNSKTTTLPTEKTDIKKDDKFVKKSKKLENVLGNIKNKVSKDKDLAGNIVNLVDQDDATSLGSVAKAKSSDMPSATSNSDVVTSIDESISMNDEENTETSNAIVESPKNDTNKRRTKHSESTEDSFGDLSSRHQELLLDLENMNIPIGDTCDVKSPDCVIIHDDHSGRIIDIDASDDDNDLDNKKNADPDINDKDTEHCNNINKEINNDENISNENTIGPEPKDDNVDDEQTLVPKNMPPLIKCPTFANTVFTSPNSYKSNSDDVTECSSISGIDMMDTISDTNLKFITDDDIEDVSDSDNRNKHSDIAIDEKNEVNVKESNEKDEDKTELNEIAVLTNKNEPKSKDTYITVYKIVPNDDTSQKPKNKFKNIPEYSSYVENLIQTETKSDTNEDSVENEISDIPDTKGQLNSFFKKCKNAYRKRKRAEVPDKTDVEINESKSPKKSITVAQEENVKYCLKCSSIFDTEDCSYCLKTQKDSDKSDQEKSFTCDKCDFVGEPNNVNTHLEEHTNDEERKT